MSKISFRRYTTLPYLLDILYEKRLALLDPATWEDRNDAHFIQLYKEKKNLKSVLAICFAEASETYQHWKIYSGSSSGVCIEFDKNRLLDKVSVNAGFRHEAIKYMTMATLRSEPPLIDELPFIKRFAFKDENEYRIIYEDLANKISINYISIIPKDIVKIVINPWVVRSVYDSVKATIKNINGFSNIQVKKSGVVENEKWKGMGANAIAHRRKMLGAKK